MNSQPLCLGKRNGVSIIPFPRRMSIIPDVNSLKILQIHCIFLLQQINDYFVNNDTLYEGEMSLHCLGLMKSATAVLAYFVNHRLGGR